MESTARARPASAATRAAALLAWLGGGQWRELGERHERSTATIAGVVVLVDAALAWLVATLAVAESTDWPAWAILPLTLLAGLLVGGVTRAMASGPTRRWSVVGRGAVAILVGAVIGELAAVVLFSGSIDHRIDSQAARSADSTPAVAQVSANLEGMRTARAALGTAVDQARLHRDQALVVARCEYNPTPACPQTQITGIPGQGPETRTANQLLADTQRELDNAIATRDREAPALDSEIATAEQTADQARRTAIANADRGLGARWVAMHEYTLANAGALVLWAMTIGFFVLLSLLPLIITWLGGETSHDRGAAARARRERAEVEADTAIAVKRAEVRAAIETMWAEQQLASARLAVEAQHEIDREVQRRRIIEVFDAPVEITAQPVEDDMYLPIAAEAEAASKALAELPSGRDHVPERAESDGPARIPNVTRAAARWIRPFVPPIVARAIGSTTQPLRTARQVFEEVEEITFSFKRNYKVTVGTEESPVPAHETGDVTETGHDVRRVESSRLENSHRLGDRDRHVGLERGNGPGELRGRSAPGQLPPAP
ncbi:MAG: DUF4407 domain-containing protein [Mycobacteriaceae bacterium]|nr:DUF4407 domain-containing protein [Mycobacteriaceae bacterium]